MFGFGFTYNTINPSADGGVPIDPDAQAFFTAASITDATQKSAVNQLVLDLKSYNIWTKMKALYPIVGGSASSHAVNLKTPGTYNLTFSTGWNHASTGMTPSGTAYADTFLNPSTQLTLNNTHISYYSRTNILESSNAEMGSYSGSGGNAFYMVFGRTGNLAYSFQYDHYTASNFVTATGQSDSRGLWISNRTSNVATTHKLWRNGLSLGNATTTAGSFLSNNIWIGAINNSLAGSPPAYYSKKECSFSSIGDGLTDADVSNLYTAVQAYQTTLGRSVGTQTVSDSDAQAFVTAASIQDQVEATAVNNLVIGLKEDSLWTKMKAIYPIVGGTASSHAVNLKTPGTYNLTFTTGWTHSSTGMTPSTAYANTSFIPNTNLTDSNNHASFYSRINASAANVCEIGSYDNSSPAFKFFGMQIKFTGDLFLVANGTNPYPTVSNTDSKGFYIMTKNSSTSVNVFKNSSKIMNGGTTGSGISTTNVWIGAFNANGTGANYSTKECSFASIGDGLTDTEANNLNTRVQSFQTNLNRQV